MLFFANNTTPGEDGWSSGGRTDSWGGASNGSGGWSSGGSNSSGGWGGTSGGGSSTSGGSGGFASYKPSGHIALDVGALVVTLLLAALAALYWGIGGEFLANLAPRISYIRPLQMGLIVASVAGLPLVGLAVWVLVHGNRYRARAVGLVAAPLAIALLFGAGWLMQYLYSLGAEAQDQTPRDYVFVIDNSSSMGWNDPDNARISALHDSLRQLDDRNRVGMVFFSHIINRVIPPETLTPDHARMLTDLADTVVPDGSTDIYGALSEVLATDMLDPARGTVVVLLTDGINEQDDHLYFKDQVAGLCADRNAIISTIALGDQADGELLARLAEETGGRTYTADNPEMLGEIYGQVRIALQDRNLLGIRRGPAKSSIPLSLLRVAAWLLFGLILGGAAFLLREDADQPFIPLIAAAVVGLALGVALELLSRLGVDNLPLTTLLTALYGVLPLFWLKQDAAPGGFGKGFEGDKRRFDEQTDLLNQEKKGPDTKSQFH